MTNITTLDRSDVSTPKMQDTLLAYVFLGIEAAQVIHDTYDSSPAGHLAVIGALLTKATPVNNPDAAYTGSKDAPEYKDVKAAYVLLGGDGDYGEALAWAQKSTTPLATTVRQLGLI